MHIFPPLLRFCCKSSCQTDFPLILFPLCLLFSLSGWAAGSFLFLPRLFSSQPEGSLADGPRSLEQHGEGLLI